MMNSNHKLSLSLLAASLIAASAAFADNSPPKADNTAQNRRDRDNSTATPMDQGNSKADLETSRQIRKEILANKSFSVNAQNVKIITQNGQVTLRGPVASAEEKQEVRAIAAKIARPENVNDQLEVKTGKETQP